MTDENQNPYRNAYTGKAFTIGKPTWTWDMFGGGQLVVHISDLQREPSWRQRAMTTLLFGSVWTRL